MTRKALSALFAMVCGGCVGWFLVHTLDERPLTCSAHQLCPPLYATPMPMIVYVIGVSAGCALAALIFYWVARARNRP